MSKREDSQINWLAIGVLLGSILGVLSAKGYYQHQEAEINAQWEAVTGHTLEQAKARVSRCKPRCYGTIAVHHTGSKK